MSEQNKPAAPHSHPRREKRPPLTHFLCLPLVNSVSLPQLESSIATFKSEIASVPQSDASRSQELQPLIPDSAIRPVGTLHLTLGVMSLPTEERFNNALNYFRGLDIVSLMTEAESRAKKRRNVTKDSSPRHALVGDSAAVAQPFTVSLESLHALPRAKSATVLHAAPVDPTSRLYPFCVLLRDKFLEAGFLQGEIQREDPPPQQNQQSTASSNAKPSKPKVRPLLLHATVVNTIYIKGRKPKSGHATSKSRKNNRYSFDAGDLLAHYQDYYLDSGRTQPRSASVNVTRRRKEVEGANDSTGPPSEMKTTNRESQHPFVWAREFPLESLCICEMGAKKLDPEGDRDGMNARLGEEYKVVARRRLTF